MSLDHNATAFTAAITVELEELAAFLRDQIDGAEETRGHDQRLTHYAKVADAGARLIQAYADHQQAVSGIFDAMERKAKELTR